MIKIKDHTQGRVSVTLHIYTMDTIGLTIDDAAHNQALSLVEAYTDDHADDTPDTQAPIVLAHGEPEPVEQAPPARPKGRRAQLSDQCRDLEQKIGGPQQDLLDKSGVTERRGTSQLAGYLAMLQTRVSELAASKPALSIAPEPETTSPSSSLFGDDSEAPI